MASSVTVLCPNKRRVTLKISPIKVLQEVLEEACKKQGFSPSGYGLTSHNKPVDLSLSFRLSGLPNNCLLEVVKQEDSGLQGPSEVEIALQLPSGDRKTVRIMSDATLLDVLGCASEGGTENLSQPPGDNMHPVLQYLNQQFQGVLLMATTSLASLGLRKGRALMRYSVKEITEGKMAEINQEVDEKQRKEAKLEEIFLKKKAEQDERDRIEAERTRFYEEERLRAEAEAAANSVLPAENNMETENIGLPPSDPLDPVPVSLLNPSASRLERLQHVLGVVDSSLTTPGSMLPFDLEETQGQVPVNSFVEAPHNSIGPHSNQYPFADFKFPESTKGQDLLQKESKKCKVVKSERNPVFYRLDEPSETENGPVEEIEEDFFELTTKDVQKMQRLLREETNLILNRALISEKMVRERNFEKKKRAWRYTVLRVLFPDKTVVQGTFYSMERVNEVYEFVTECLESPSPDFFLSLPPSFKLKEKEQSLIEAGLAPAATVIFRPVENSVYKMKKELLDARKSKAEAMEAARQILERNESFVPYQPVVVESGGRASANAESVLPTATTDRRRENRTDTSPGSAPSVPKWLKGIKK